MAMLVSLVKFIASYTPFQRFAPVNSVLKFDTDSWVKNRFVLIVVGGVLCLISLVFIFTNIGRWSDRSQ